MWKRLIIICALGSFAGVSLTLLHPVNSTMLRLAFLVCLVGTWMGVTILTFKNKPLRWVLLILPVLVALPFMLPGGKIDEDELREDYVRRMAKLEGTKYFWGGESSRGIDCSGLPRRALRDALFSYGLRHLNGGAFRGYLEQWWFDASAKALAEEYRGYARPLATAGTIKEMDYGDLLPGDLAVTVGGVHILAYAGDGLWIQADPGVGKVVTLAGRTDDNSWFDTPMTTHRWRVLSP